MKIKGLWHKLTHLGTTGSENIQENRRIILTNQIALTLLIVSAQYLYIFRIFEEEVLSNWIVPLDIGFILCLY